MNLAAKANKNRLLFWRAKRKRNILHMILDKKEALILSSVKRFKRQVVFWTKNACIGIQDLTV